jgi:hypothetical protein
MGVIVVNNKFAIKSIEMTSDQLNQIALKWFNAFNRHNVDDLLSLYHHNASHYSPKLKERDPQTNGLIIGKDAMRDWWSGAFERLPSLQYEVIRLTPCEDRVFMEYMRHVKAEPDIYVGELLEITDGLIILSRVFHS